MAYQEVTTTKYGQRVGKSFKSIGSGFLLIILGSVLLWWNEGRAVKTAKMLKDASANTVLVQDVSSIDPSLEGKLIHASAFAKTDDVLTDPDFGVSANAVKLDRKVEYYQWSEQSSTQTVDKVGGSQETTTTYTYSKSWTGSPVDSDQFKDPEYKGLNTVNANVSANSQVAANVSFGAYRLPKNLISSISGTVPAEVNLTENQIQRWADVVKKSKGISNSFYAMFDTETYVHIDKNVIYLGKNPSVPEIGDVKITFTKVMPCDVSILAQVQGDTFTAYTAKNGKTFSVLMTGVVAADQMYEKQEAANKTMLWVFRILGILIVIAGFNGIFGFITTLLKVLPFLSKIVGAGIGLVAKVLGFAWSLIIIALAWLVYRPVLAIVLLAAVIAFIVFLVNKAKANKAAEPVEAVEPAAPNEGE